MPSRLGEICLDVAAIRSIWDDSYSGTKAYAPSSNRSSFSAASTSSRSNSYSGMYSGRRATSPTMFGSLGLPPSPTRKKSLGAYDCSSTASYSSTGHSLDSTGSTPKRSSLCDCTSGYSSGSGRMSPIFPVSSDYSSDFSSPTRSKCSSLCDSLDQFGVHEKESDKQQLNLIAKAISSLLMTRGNSIDDRVDTIKELFSLTTNATRRASVACTGAHHLESDRRGNSAQHHHHRGSLQIEMPLSGHNSYGLGNSGIYSSSQQSSYELVLERIEREAKMRRTSAYQSDTTFTWKGSLVTRFHQNPTYASKVFIGGLPYDVTPDALTDLFAKFGLVTVQFPPRGRGHAYLVFDSEQQVQALLNACENKGPGQFFFWVSSRRGKDRQSQVIPWAVEDSDWLPPPKDSSNNLMSSLAYGDSSDGSDHNSSNSDNSGSGSSNNILVSKRNHDQSNAYKQNTVFVGALHGEITAEGLQNILSDLFGPVIHVGIDTDKSRYPNGSARVTFESRESFHRAVLAEFVQVVTPRFSKTIQLDAYIEDGICSECKAATPVFCRHPSCFRYYCPMCFEEHRRTLVEYHPPVMRNRNNGVNNGSNSHGLHNARVRSHVA